MIKPNRKKMKFVHAFDCFAQIIGLALKTNGRIWSKDVSEQTGVCIRSAQRYLAQLEDYGYLYSDKNTPCGYRPTAKAKQLFEVKG